MRLLFRLLILLLLLGRAGVAHADWDDRPGFDFQPVSTPEAPCGVGTPPRGHLSREIVPASRGRPLVMIVRQDAHRLCYVVDSIAEAPVIRVRQGETLTITLRNEITDPHAIDSDVAVGRLDRPNRAVAARPGSVPIVAGFRHVATGETNLHFHGFAVPPVAPQDEVLKTCTDPAVGPPRCGHREVTYHVHIPEDQPAGLYWYHPHIHGEVQAQMLMGLSGAIVIEGKADDERRAAGIQDRIFIIRQSKDIDAKGTAPVPQAPIAAAAPSPDAVPASPPPANPGGLAIDTRDEMPCNANAGTDELTFNGSKVVDGDAPDAELAPLPIAEGTIQLWRILNAATDAFLDLALVDEKGVPQPIELVARDGAPITDDDGHPLPRHPTTDSQLVPPAGRLEFLVAAPPLGRKFYLVTRRVDTGCAGDQVPARKLGLVTAVARAGAPAEPAALPVDKTEPDTFSGLLARRTDRVRIVAMAEYPRPGNADLNDFYIAELKPGAVLRPFEPGGAPAIVTGAGATEEWIVENWTRELHAFHIHQVHFRVLSVNGHRLARPPLLDTVNVPYALPDGPGGRLVPGRVRIKLHFPAALAGDIPFHCHLVDHEDAGMMGVVRVVRGGQAAVERATRLAAIEAALDNPPICRGSPPH